MEIKVGRGIINQFEDDASFLVGENHVSCNFGLHIEVFNKSGLEQNKIISNKVSKWFKEKIIDNPKLIESLEKEINYGI